MSEMISSISNKILEKLSCPDCKSSVQVSKDEKYSYECLDCEYKWIKDGVIIVD